MDVPPELRLPPFSKALNANFCVPWTIYFCFFRFISFVIKRQCWNSYSGFKKYRLQNLSICLFHSLISGTSAAIHFWYNTSTMLDDDAMIYWHDNFKEQLPIMCIAYFCHDALHMLQNEWNRYTTELLIHHTITCVSLASGVLPRRFLQACYWALLMEINSIFLHSRTILQISGYGEKRKTLYKAIVYINVITFLFCRFLSQFLFFCWGYRNFNRMHWWYSGIAVLGPFSFAIINGTLFLRIIVADGFLGDSLKSSVAINRDQLAEPEKQRVDEKKSN